MIPKWVLKMWIIINKKHFVIFLDNCTQEYKATKKQIVRHQLSIDPRTSFRYKRKTKKRFLIFKICSGYEFGNRKPTCPWVVLIDWLSFGKGGGRGVRLELDVKGQGGGRMLDIARQGEWGVSKLHHFYRRHVYCPLLQKFFLYMRNAWLSLSIIFWIIWQYFPVTLDLRWLVLPTASNKLKTKLLKVFRA